MKDKGLEKFLDYLDGIEENCKLFRSMVLTTELLSELPLTDEQVEFANKFFDESQKEWSKSFVELLEFGVEWLNNNMNDE